MIGPENKKQKETNRVNCVCVCVCVCVFSRKCDTS